MKRKLLQQMAEHLSGIVDEKRTTMQIDQKIRDEIRQVKKYFRYKVQHTFFVQQRLFCPSYAIQRQDMLGTAGYSREIRLSTSQQYIADKLRTKPRLPGFFDDPELRPMEVLFTFSRMFVSVRCKKHLFCSRLSTRR